MGWAVVAAYTETYPTNRSHVSVICVILRLQAKLRSSTNNFQYTIHNRGQADFYRRKEGLLVVRSNMHDGITLTYKNFRKSVRCEHADGNALLPVRFVKGQNQIVATHDIGQVGVWDLSLNWLCTVTHPSKVHVLAVSILFINIIH